MKTYTQNERAEARKKVPQPLRDFMGSKILGDIYLGIQKKHKLNIRQLFLFTEISTLTLLGLEPESAVETNLHQAMHELSNAGTRELVADLNDRVFKEAQRWVRENIIDENALGRIIPDEPRLTSEERAARDHATFIMNARLDDPEFIATEKREEEEAKKRKGAYETELEAGRLAIIEIERKAQEAEAAGKSAVGAAESAAPQSAPAQTQAPSIALQKLGAPTTSKPEEVRVQSSELRVESAEKSEPPRKADVYRESIE